MFDLSAPSLDLQNRGHVKQLALRNTFGFKLPGIRRILPSLLDGHVKHGFEHVKLKRDRVVHRRGHVRPSGVGFRAWFCLRDLLRTRRTLLEHVAQSLFPEPNRRASIH